MKAMPQKVSKTKLLVHHPALLIHGPKNHHALDILSIPEILRRAETMTPLLKAILDFRPRPHWK